MLCPLADAGSFSAVWIVTGTVENGAPWGAAKIIHSFSFGSHRQQQWKSCP
jgi:hypothetical protein